MNNVRVGYYVHVGRITRTRSPCERLLGLRPVTKGQLEPAELAVGNMFFKCGMPVHEALPNGLIGRQMSY